MIDVVDECVPMGCPLQCYFYEKMIESSKCHIGSNEISSDKYYHSPVHACILGESL